MKYKDFQSPNLIFCFWFCWWWWKIKTLKWLWLICTLTVTEGGDILEETNTKSTEIPPHEKNLVLKGSVLIVLYLTFQHKSSFLMSIVPPAGGRRALRKALTRNSQLHLHVKIQTRTNPLAGNMINLDQPWWRLLLFLSLMLSGYNYFFPIIVKAGTEVCYNMVRVDKGHYSVLNF